MKTPAINRLLKKNAPKKKRKPGVTKNLVKAAKKRKKKTAVKAVMVAGRHLNPIESYGDGGVSITGKQELDYFRLLSLRGALKLEMLGMKATRRGPSAYSIIKKEMGWKGSREKVLAQLEAEIVARKASLAAQDKFKVAGQPASGFYVAKYPGTAVGHLMDGPFNTQQDASNVAWEKYPVEAQTAKVLIVQVGRGRESNPSKHGRPFVRAKRQMFDDYDFQIAGHFLPALINGDTSGLSANEEHQLEQLVAQVPPGGHWDVISEEGYFGEDEVTGLRANVYDVKYYAPRKHFVKGRRHKNPSGDHNPYVEAGFKNRREYLASLAEEYGVPLSVVHAIAGVLGPNEDFDGLVTHLEDEADRFQDGYGDNPRRVRPSIASMKSVARRGRNVL